jgi:hypothetical protein
MGEGARSESLCGRGFCFDRAQGCESRFLWVPARDILGGWVPPPEVTNSEIIEAAEGLDETGVPDAASLPGNHRQHIGKGPMTPDRV